MRAYHLISIVVLILISHDVWAGNCEQAVTNKKALRPNRKTLGAGALLRLKPKLVELEVKPNTFVGNQPAESVRAYFPDLPMFAEQIFELAPEQEMRTLGPVKKNGDLPYYIEVELLPHGQKAVMYWVDVYNNALVIEEGETLTPKVRPAKILFPNSWDRARATELWKIGQTAWGRPRAQLGQLVWAANTSRLMSKGSVGILEEFNEATNMATIRTLAGKKKIAYFSDCIPLTKEEQTWFD